MAEEIEGNDEYSKLGADLAAAWDDSEDEEETDVVTASAEDTPEVVAEPEAEEGVEEPEPIAAEESSDDPPVEAQSSDVPVGLPPEAREAWKDTPPAMQKAIADREKQYSTHIQQYAEGAKRAQGMDQALRPYQQYLQMNGGNSHIGTLLQTGAGLQMGSPIQKAQTIAKLISDYGVDIATLDGMLTDGQAPQNVQQQSNVQEAVNQAMAPYQDFMGSMQQRQQQEQQQQQQQVVSTVESFSKDPKNEFYNDVSGDMADLMDLSAQRGQHLSMEDAYAKACQMNSGVSTTLASRRSSQEIEQKRLASASITGNPGGPGGTNQAPDIRSAIADAWENAGRV